MFKIKKKDYNKNICFSDPCYFHSLNTANGHHFDFPYHSKMRTPSYNVQLLIPNHHKSEEIWLQTSL